MTPGILGWMVMWKGIQFIRSDVLDMLSLKCLMEANWWCQRGDWIYKPGAQRRCWTRDIHVGSMSINVIKSLEPGWDKCRNNVKRGWGSGTFRHLEVRRSSGKGHWEAVVLSKMQQRDGDRVSRLRWCYLCQLLQRGEAGWWERCFAGFGQMVRQLSLFLQVCIHMYTHRKTE